MDLQDLADAAVLAVDRIGAGVLELQAVLEDPLARIRHDIESGIASGEVRGTPTLFIDGVVHRGGYEAAELMEALSA